MSTHQCPGGCGKWVPRQKFACPGCWFALPAELRRAISDNYRRDPGAHMDAMAAAIEWYATNRPQQTERRPT